jgi:hypothetical protein
VVLLQMMAVVFLPSLFQQVEVEQVVQAVQ